MKILLLSPPFRKDYMRNARCDFVSLSGTQWFPLLLGYLGAFLEAQGCDVKLIDAPAYNLSLTAVEKMYQEYKPDVLVVYPGDKSRESDIAFTDKLLAGYTIPAIFVGPYFSMESEYFLTQSKTVRYGVEGEFEYPVWEWIKQKNPREIQNLVYKDSNLVVKNQLRHYLTTPELDRIPFVSDFFARHLDFKYYRTSSEPHPFVDIMVGRGCQWGVCTFCLWVHTFVKGPVYNRRSIENVVEEFAFVEKRLHGVRSVMMQDDTFPEDTVIAFCEAKIRRDIRLRWSCYARANLSLPTLKLMKKAGCLNLHVGFESANDDVLKQIHKGLTREQMTEFAYNAKKSGLNIHGDFLIGLPGETAESIRDLIKWACRIRPYTAQFQIFIPFKGTPIYAQLEKDGVLHDGVIEYPHLSRTKIEYFTKLAYRKFYFSIPYALSVVRHPVNLFFKKIKTISRSLPSMFWKKLDIR